MKVCTKCGEEKELSEFHNKGNGKCAQCKLCIAIKRKKHYKNNKEKEDSRNKIYSENNKEKITANNKIYRENNREKIALRDKNYRENNKEEVALREKIWRDNNRGIRNATEARRNAAKLQATPIWANMKMINHKYIEADELGLTVDHDIPLQGKLVCGLHCEDNLQLMSASENSAKCNKFVVE